MTAARWLQLLGGPAFFVFMFAVQIPGMETPIRGSLGLLVWMASWWIFQPVHLAVTGFLPLAVLAVFDFLPASSILPAYAQQLVILLLGANVLTALWHRSGLDRRIALVSLLGLGTGTRRQIVVLFAVSAVLSAFLPNIIVAATMMPVVVAMLGFIGITDIGRSAFGSALLIAVAWGTSAGGAGTPLGGAPNLLVVDFIETVSGRELLFTTWVMRLMPLTVAGVLVASIFVRFAFRPEIDRVNGTRDFFRREFRALGPMSVAEKWGLLLFLAAAVLAFSRQLYASVLPGLTPAFAFLACAVLAFVARHRGEPIMDWAYAEKHIVWGLIYLFAGGSALGQVLADTGTAQFLADRLLVLVGSGSFTAVVVFSLMTIVITQITSNTAAVAIIVPITISTFGSLDLNPIPFVYMVAAVGNCGFLLPSSAGGPAIAAGYGANVRNMLGWGLGLTVLVWITILLVGYTLVTYWPAFGNA